jgi:DCC1-like thiol-disulfide oxidoreductase
MSTEEPPSAAEMVSRKLAALVGYDTVVRPRALFLYDGGCGVCKFLVQFVIQRDQTDAIRFAPLQSPVAEEICHDLHITIDLSTAVLILDHGRVVHTHSSSLAAFPVPGLPLCDTRTGLAGDTTIGPRLWLRLIRPSSGRYLEIRQTHHRFG